MLRAEGRTVGRLDGRFAGWLHEGNAEVYDEDPSYDAILGPYAAGINHYLRTELDYVNDLPYEMISAQGAALVLPGVPEQVGDRDPGAGPGHAGQPPSQDARRLRLSRRGHARTSRPSTCWRTCRSRPELRLNIESAYYPAGHMMYVHEPSRLQQSADLADFITRSLPGCARVTRSLAGRLA